MKIPNATDRRGANRTLAVSGLLHALHDGYTDLIYVLLPIWQAEFGLSYSLLAVLRGLYAGSMAALQVPAGRLSQTSVDEIAAKVAALPGVKTSKRDIED